MVLEFEGIYRKKEIPKDLILEEDRIDPDVTWVYYKGLRVGLIKKTSRGKVYITHRDFNLHFFKIFEGYGISLKVLKELKKLKVRRIIIIEKHGSGEFVLASEINDWFRYGKEYVYEFPYGTKDKQLVLPRIYFDIIT